MDAVARAAVKTVNGTTIAIDDAEKGASFMGISLFGKTTQEGTPTSATPFELINVCGEGNVNVDIQGESISAMLSGSLRGIPVASGGNYTDANGRQWVCDEVDLVRGVLIRRVGSVSGSEFTWYANGSRWQCTVKNPSAKALASKDYFPIMCNIASYSTSGAQNTCRSGNQTNAGMMLVYAPADRDMSDVVVYYQCEPEEIQLWNIEDVGLEAPDKSFAITNNGGAEMSVSYIVDFESYIRNIVSEMIAEEVT